MAKYKVRHGLISYTAERNGREVRETAFRGQVVDIRKDEVERLESHGAIVSEDEELPRPGSMLPLPETASDEEIRNWALGATDAEVREVIQTRPMLADRVEAAHRAVKEDLEHQAEHLGEKAEVAQEAAKESEEEEQEEQSSESSAPTTATEQQRAQAEAETEADNVVKGSNAEVSKYLSEHPEHANAIMDAETRRAQATGEEPRQGVRRAVEAAAGHAGQ